jgi:hypothetical protein
MFRVNRQEGRAPSPDGIHENLSGHHQRLFVGQQDPLAGPCRRERKWQPSRANNRGNDRIGLRMTRQVKGRLLATQNLCPNAGR